MILVSALAGAAGIAEAAASAHLTSEPLLQTSSNFLLVMAAAVIATCAVALATTRRPVWFLVAGSILLGGCLLFCSDMTCRVFLARRLFAFAAPAGGSLMIVGWLAIAVAAIATYFRAPEA